MTDKEMNALLHELRCRDEYALTAVANNLLCVSGGKTYRRNVKR